MDLNRDVIFVGEDPVPKDTLALILVGFLATAILVFRAFVIAPRTRRIAKQAQLLSIKPAKEPTYYYTRKRAKRPSRSKRSVPSQIERPSAENSRQKREWRSGYYTPYTPTRSATYRHDLTSFYAPTKAPSDRYEADYGYHTYTPYHQDTQFNHRTYSPYISSPSYISSSSSRPPTKRQKPQYYFHDDDDVEVSTYEYDQDPYRLSEFKEILHDIRDLLSHNRAQASDRVYSVQASPGTFGGLKWYEWLFPLLAIAATAAFLVETYVKLPEITIAKKYKLEMLDVVKDAITIVRNEIVSWKSKP